MSISEIRRSARQTLREAERSPYLTTLAFLLLLYAVLIPFNVFSICYSYAADAAEGCFDAIGRIGRYYTFMLLAPYLVSFLSNVWDAGYTGYTVALAKDRGAGFGALLDSLRQLGKVIWLAFLILAFTALWMCLFVIPGIVAFYRYRLAFQILFDNPQLSAREALEESKRLTWGRKLFLFQLDLSFFYYYLPYFACAIIINIPYYFALSDLSAATELAYYLAGTAPAIVLQLLFLPHLRQSLTTAYFRIRQAEAQPPQL